VIENTKRKARPERMRFSLWDDAAGATPLEIPERRMWPAGLIVAVMFAMFAGVEWTTIARMSGQSIRDVFDLMFPPIPGILGPYQSRSVVLHEFPRAA
jgi:hypothetical protein